MMLRVLVCSLVLAALAAGCGGEDVGREGCDDQSCIGKAWTAGAFGDPCQVAEECQSSLCGQDTETGKLFCTQLCDASTSPCPDGAGCFPTGGTQQVCGPPSS